MSNTLRLSMVAMLGAGALFTGGVVWYAWERVWLWQRLPLASYAIDFRRSVRKADPALPILLLITGTAAGIFASITGGLPRTLAIIAIIQLGFVLVGSLLLAEPINSQFRRRREGDVPPEAANLRDRWRRFHLLRTGFVIAAFFRLVTAVTYV